MPAHSHHDLSSSVTPARLRAAAAAAVVTTGCLIAGLLGCGPDQYPTTANPPVPAPPVRGAPQPASPSGAFEPGDFADLPIPSGAKPLDDPHLNGTVTVRSWEVAGRTPEQLLQYYTQQLPPAGWKVLSPPAPVGQTVWAGQWTRPHQQLQVTATALDSTTAASYRTQLDLALTVY